MPEIVDQAIEIGANVVWMQLGIIHEDAAAKARSHGLQVVMDKCTKPEYTDRFLSPQVYIEGHIRTRKIRENTMTAQQFPDGRCQCQGVPIDFERFFFKHIGLSTYYAEHIHSIQAVNKSVGTDAAPLKYATTRWILLPKLKSDSAEMRSYAAQALESMGDTQAVLPLIDALAGLGRHCASLCDLFVGGTAGCAGS